MINGLSISLHSHCTMQMQQVSVQAGNRIKVCQCPFDLNTIVVTYVAAISFYIYANASPQYLILC